MDSVRLAGQFSVMTDALETMIARDAIRHCLSRLARGEDRRSAALISASYWPDSVTDYGVFRGTFAEYLAWVTPGSDAIANTQHHLGQSYIKLTGLTAKAETQVISYHRMRYGDADEHDVVLGGRYLDVFEKRGDDWRIASRTMLYDWYQDWGASIDWSAGVMGMAFSAPTFAGRANDDRSESFFSAR